ncbi:phage tail-collar fiber domain-containing protein [Vibrio parahaemolyticus]|uniref:phage tail-collar fiber domain-containing protein n=1 Tax=Vibrio parahaemolyticus TaxID=670 RepID=UPI002269AD56|nr:phage tail protein [Vibrio parahaemolyticus]MCX8827913.1 phage tail protein [Vibrio parahaemolyticus]MCX8928663.1 phage tail protein [Vibrio parahaemolyticus]
MANTTDKSILTAAGKALLAQLNAEEKPLIIDKMMFANVPNRPEFPQPDDVVPTDDIVHQEQVEQRGRLSADSVIYSTTLTSDIGPFEFNWTGAYCSEYGVLVTIDHHALTPKTADEPGVAGNTLVRSVVLEYKDIAEITNITVDASSWQYNATDRMKKMDSDVAQSIIDQNGKDWFIEDGFLVTPSGSAYNIKAGAGYVSGNRVSMEFDRSVQIPNKPSFIYIDAHREGTPTGEQVTLFDFVITSEEKDDYIDSSTGKDIPHFVCKIAEVLADGTVSDLRPESSFKGWVLQKTTTQLDTVADLKKYKGSYPSQRVRVLGYYEPYDYGGGAFYWSEQSDDADDGGVTIKPDSISSGTGRWVRDAETITFNHFGAKRYKFDHVFESASDAFNRAALWSKLNQRPVYFYEEHVYYCSEPVEIGDAIIRSTSGVKGGADPMFLRRPDGTYVFNTPNWNYYFNWDDQGRNFTWKEMVTETCYGPAVISDLDGGIFTAELGTKFNVAGFALVGDHRKVSQHGLASATPHVYKGTGQRSLDVRVIGTGSHGIFLPNGLEVSRLSGVESSSCNGHGLYTGYIAGVDCATEYIEFLGGGFLDNRLDGIYLSQLRKSLRLNGVGLSGNGQYDSPGGIDPLLGYDRTLPQYRRDYKAGVRVNDTTLDSVGMTGFTFGVRMDSCFGEKIAKVLHVRGRNGVGVVRDISLSSNHFIRLGKLQSHVAGGGENGVVFYFDCKYLADFHSEGNYPQSLDLFDFEAVDAIQPGSFYIFDDEFIPITDKELAVAKTVSVGDVECQKNVTVTGRVLGQTLSSSLNIGGVAGTYTFNEIVDDYRYSSPVQNRAGIVSTWSLTTHWQATNENKFGGYYLAVTRMPSGKYMLNATPMGSIDGFTVPPTIDETTGVLSVTIEDYFRLNLHRLDIC